jgi:fructan beta-fructosidase
MKLLQNTIVLLILLAIAPIEPAMARDASNFQLKKEVAITANNLLLPVVFRDRSLSKEEQDKRYQQIRLYVFVDEGKTLVHKQVFDFPRDLKDVTYWGYLDMSEYVGQNAILGCDRPGREILFDQVKFSDEQGEYREPLYSEKMRPQYHFTPKQGWSNDPNGLYYADGLYHMSFQNGALNRGWGNIYWGHAVSKDLLHWEESSDWPRLLRSGGGGFTRRHPSMANGECYSGGAVVDVDNRLGLQEPGGPLTVVIAYTDSSGFGECLAVSTDGGKRFVNMENNPAIVLPNVHNPKDKKSWGRDPKPFWHEPTQRWVMVTYLMGEVPGMVSGHMTFYTSQDMKTWEYASTTEKLFPESYPDVNGKPNPASRDSSKKDFHECPDFFELPVDGDETNNKWVLIGGAMKYQVGSFDGTSFTPDEKVYHQNMFGDMKAGQAFSNVPFDRVVYVLWSRLRTNTEPMPPFVQGITLPVEFTLNSTPQGLRLRTHPIAEMATIRGKELYSKANISLKTNEVFSFDPTMDTIEVEMSGTASTDAKVLIVNFGEGNDLALDFSQQEVKGIKIEGAPQAGKTFSLRFFIDRAQWNVFVNDGVSYHHYARRDTGQPLKNFNMVVRHGGTVTIDSLKVHEVKSVWNKK